MSDDEIYKKFGSDPVFRDKLISSVTQMVSKEEKKKDQRYLGLTLGIATGLIVIAPVSAVVIGVIGIGGYIALRIKHK